MDESITRAAGGVNGQEMNATSMRTLIRSLDRVPLQRTTLYQPAATCDRAWPAV
jgi:FO synthase